MSKVILKTSEEIELIRISSLLVGDTHAEVAKHIRPGIKTSELDKIAETFIRDMGGIPSFKGFGGFPASLCISVNQAVVHGIPGNYEIQPGDVLSVDCGVFKNGFHGDSAYTYLIQDEQIEDKKKLLKITLECLEIGCTFAAPGNRVGDIGSAIQKHAEKHGYGVVRELVGHGLGRELHEKPEVPNYGKAGSGPLLKPGTTICIEPMINMGTKAVKTLADKWTIVTADAKPSAHFEHVVAITEQGTEILSSFLKIEEEIKKNEYLVSI
ncbi:MAG: type I methionyl aminopeptidase [Flavobacteriales bacterium]|nr:type I methionyl aminopeptidase [Flavobacteriales bacterium]